MIQHRDAGAAGCRMADHALEVIRGERAADEYVARLHAQQADPEELALLLAEMYGAALLGFCRVIEKAIGGLR
jgi:hypothetical protein